MMFNPKQIGRALWSGTLSLILYFSGLFVFFTPIPLLYLSLKKERTPWFIGFFTTVILAFTFYMWVLPDIGREAVVETSNLQSFGSAYLAYYMLICFLISFGIWKRWKLMQIGVVVSLTVTSAVLGLLFVLQKTGVYDVWGFLNGIVVEVSSMLDQAASAPHRWGKQEDAIVVATQIKAWLPIIPKLLPSLIFTFTVFVLCVNIGVMRLFYKVSKPMKWAGDFRRLQISSACVWILIASGTAFFIDIDFLKCGWLKIMAANLLIAAAFIYFIQGLSILAFFIKRYSLLFRFGIYGLLIFFFQMMGLVVMGLGLADIWFDFRKLQKSKLTSST